MGCRMVSSDGDEVALRLEHENDRGGQPFWLNPAEFLRSYRRDRLRRSAREEFALLTWILSSKSCRIARTRDLPTYSPKPSRSSDDLRGGLEEALPCSGQTKSPQHATGRPPCRWHSQVTICWAFIAFGEFIGHWLMISDTREGQTKKLQNNLQNCDTRDFWRSNCSIENYRTLWIATMVDWDSVFSKSLFLPSSLR